MRCTRFKLASLFLFLLPMAAQAQGPVKVTPCDLVKNPQKYTRQWVEVRGAVSLAFEDFSLKTGNCGKQLRGVWLAFGGDEPTPTASTVNDNERVPGSVLKVEGIPVPLLRDASLDLFMRRLTAQRETLPDGSPCGDNCPLYRVTATITGLFMAAAESDASLSPYGHLGCCHLLAIREVADVTATRTEIPAGGSFVCTTDMWDMNATEAENAFRNYTCRELSDCLAPFRPLVQHWRDQIDLNDVGDLESSENSPLWRSADLLTTYEVQARYKSEKHEDDLIGAKARRTVCRAIQAPYPPSTPIGCRQVSIDFDVNKHEEQPPGWLGEPSTVAPLALEEAARRWGIQVLPGAVLKGCDKPEIFDGKQLTLCSFAEPTSMQTFTITLSRRRTLYQLRGWKNVPWTLASGGGLVCTAEGSK